MRDIFDISVFDRFDTICVGCDVFCVGSDVFRILSDIFRVFRNIGFVLSDVFRVFRNIGFVLSDVFCILSDIIFVGGNCFADRHIVVVFCICRFFIDLAADIRIDVDFTCYGVTARVGDGHGEIAVFFIECQSAVFERRICETINSVFEFVFDIGDVSLGCRNSVFESVQVICLGDVCDGSCQSFAFGIGQSNGSIVIRDCSADEGIVSRIGERSRGLITVVDGCNR